MKSSLLAGPHTTRHAPESARRPRALAVHPLRILLCEDDELIRLSVAELLASAGHTIEEAGNAAHAMQIHSEQPIDLLITDIGLPDMSGIELVAHLRTNAPELPVLFSTGRLDEISSLIDMRTRALLKPYGADALFAAVAMVCPVVD